MRAGLGQCHEPQLRDGALTSADHSGRCTLRRCTPLEILTKPAPKLKFGHLDSVAEQCETLLIPNLPPYGGKAVGIIGRSLWYQALAETLS